MNTSIASKNSITLKGSTEIVGDFFYYGINSILYQRGIYPEESFTQTKKYGRSVVITTDNELQEYLNSIIKQIKLWLLDGMLKKLVLVIKNVRTQETIERWQFDIECDEVHTKENKEPRQKSEGEIQKELGDVIRQIVSTVTFLPILDFACEFDLIVYTGNELELPTGWGDTGPQFIANSNEVKLRSFSTTIHKVDSMVAYKVSDY